MDITAANPTSTTSLRGRPRQGPGSISGSWPLGVKLAASAVLVGAPVAQILNRSLFDMGDGYHSLFQALAANPGMVAAGSVAGMFAPALVIGSVLIWFRLSRSASRIAAPVSLAAGVVAFTCLAVTTGYSFSALALNDAHLGTAAVADALASYMGPPAPLLFITFDLTSTISILAAAWALWRSHAVPRTAAVLLALFIVVDMAVPLPFDAHIVGLGATLLMSASFFTAAPLPRSHAAAKI